MLYYVETVDKGGNTAGPKAPQDIYDITKNIGGRSLLFREFPRGKGKFYQKFWLLFVGGLQWLRILMTVKAGDTVIWQHPMRYGFQLNNKFIPYIQKKKKVKFIAVIHDLETLREGTEGNELHFIADTVLLPKFDKIICHNDSMKNYLSEKGFDEDKLVSLEIFDYLTDTQMSNQKEDGVAVAGNLSPEKSSYIYKLLEQAPNFKLNLFGPNFEGENLPDSVEYFGSFPPSEVPEKLRGRFGLVWDGDSVETCSGNTGNYLKYNNPHKTSLYLASGLPVIIWKEAALAKFVENNNVGLTVNSLLEIDDALALLSSEDYMVMKQNAVDLGMKLREGYYYQKALNQCINKENN